MFALMFRIKLLFFLSIFSGYYAIAQHTFLPINSFTNYYTDRLEIMGIIDNTTTSLKPYSREISYNFNLNNTSKNNIIDFGNKKAPQSFKYILNDNILLSNIDTSSESVLNSFKAFKKSFYTHPSALFSVNKPDFTFVINPVLGFSGGIDVADNNSSIFRNTRGIEVSGKIDGKLGFYSFISENQMRFPAYFNNIIDSTGVIPGYGFHKPFGSNAYDFFLARGYITFSPLKHVGVQFGHDRNFIGNGYRSLILSNFSTPYLFIKINTKFKNFNYQNLYTQLSDYNYNPAEGGSISHKYFVNHYLGIKFLKNFNIGFFESVIYDRSKTSNNSYFDINYLNPVIFYRAIEHNLNSSDNVMVGTDWKFNFLNKFSLYGQFIIDEFIKDEMVKHTRSWVNKFGVQNGLKYINAFGVKYLDLQIEHNIVRPYMYMHFKQSQNFVNYNQALAHPLGANFKEIVLLAKYQPSRRLFIEGCFINAIKGLDSSSTSLRNGGNILLTYLNRPKENGIKIGDGIKTNFIIFYTNASYMIYHNIWFDAGITVRNAKSTFDKYDNKCILYQLGLRMNLSPAMFDF